MTRILNGSPSTGTYYLPLTWKNVSMPLNSWKGGSLMGQRVFIVYASSIWGNPIHCSTFLYVISLRSPCAQYSVEMWLTELPSCMYPLFLARRWCITCFQCGGHWNVFMEANYIHCSFEPCVYRSGMLLLYCHVNCDVNMVSRNHHLDKYSY